jgi:hypothetical protein
MAVKNEINDRAAGLENGLIGEFAHPQVWNKQSEKKNDDNCDTELKTALGRNCIRNEMKPGGERPKPT